MNDIDGLAIRGNTEGTESAVRPVSGSFLDIAGAEVVNATLDEDDGLLTSQEPRELDTQVEKTTLKVVLSESQRSLVEDHLSLVGHVTFQVAVNFPRHVDREELMTAGALGLVEAAGRFNSDLGVPFERFAAQRIRGAILDQVRREDWAPRSVRRFERSVEQFQQSLAVELGNTPTEAQLAEAMGISLKDMRKLRDKAYASVILALEFDINDGDEDLTLLEVLSNPDQKDPLGEIEERELRSFVVDAASQLPEKQRYAVVGYFIEGRSSKDLAKALGITESRISQLKTEGLEMIRYALGAEYDEVGEYESSSRSSRVQQRLGSYAERVSDASTWKERLSGPHRLSWVPAPQQKLEKRADIVRRGKVSSPLNSAELSKVLGYFLFNDNARLEEMRRANPDFDYLNTVRFARIRRRISIDLEKHGVQIKWDAQGKTRGTRYTIRILKGGDELERLIYGNRAD